MAAHITVKKNDKPIFSCYTDTDPDEDNDKEEIIILDTCFAFYS